MENLLFKVRNLPEFKRKIILGAVITILGLILLSCYIKNVQRRLESFEMEEFKKEIQFPSLEEELKNLLQIEIPKF